MKVELIESMWNDNTPTIRARTSYNSDKKDYTEEQNDKLLRRLIWDKHFWVLEGNIFNFMIECDIPTARQIMRHRTFSYNEKSRRYLDNIHTPFEFYTPDPRWDKDKEIELDKKEFYEIFRLSYEEGVKRYDKLLSMWVAKEIARYVIPQWMTTSFYMTWNLRNWFHFLELRADSHAQKEVRDIANLIKENIRKICPKIVKYYFKEESL